MRIGTTMPRRGELCPVLARCSPFLLAAVTFVFVLVLGALEAGSARAQESETGVQPIPGFDHAEMAGFPLDGAHAAIICESCHVDSQLSGTPRTCIGCHDGSRARGKPASHPPAGNTCSQCHTTANFVPFDFDHTSINQACETCHEGGRARGMPAGHIPIQGSCDDCHVTTGFETVRLEHSSVVGTCISCHDGGVAPGMPPDHIAVPDDCGGCHNTFTFAGAIFDHMLVDQPCANCHNNQVVLGKPVDHIPAPETCDDCHTPFFEQNFTAVSLDHNVVPGDCASCHFPGNNWGAPYKPATHPPGASEDCEACHSTFAFSIGQVVDHVEVFGQCIDCHYAGNTFGAPSMPNAHIATSTSCDGCHDPFSGAFSLAMMDHAFISGSAMCVDCHTPGNFYGAQRMPPAHIATSTTCDGCHDPFSGAFSNVMMDHFFTAGGSVCIDCHVPANFYGATSRDPAWHTALETDNDCTGCHMDSDTSFGMAIMDHFFTSFSTVGCVSCHVTNPGNWNARSRPTWHQSTSMNGVDCTTCHVAAEPPTAAAALLDHDDLNSSGSGACADCHNPTFYIQPQTPHGSVSNSCSVCHQATEVREPDMCHSEIGGSPCADCHNPSNLWGAPTSPPYSPPPAACIERP